MAYDGGGPVHYYLMVLDRLEKAIPRMKQIWEYGADAQAGAHAAFAADLKERDEMLPAYEAAPEERRELMHMRREKVA